MLSHRNSLISLNFPEVGLTLSSIPQLRIEVQRSCAQPPHPSASSRKQLKNQPTCYKDGLHENLCKLCSLS